MDNNRRTSSISGSSSVTGILRPTLVGNTSSNNNYNSSLKSSTPTVFFPSIGSGNSSTTGTGILLNNNNKMVTTVPLTFNTPIGILTSNELVSLLHESLPIRDIRSSLVLYRNVFTSQDFIDTIITKGLVHNGDMFSALAFGNSLISNNLLIHAKDPRQPFKSKISSLYRLTIHGGSGPKGTEIILPPKPIQSSRSTIINTDNREGGTMVTTKVDNNSVKSPRPMAVSFSTGSSSGSNSNSGNGENNSSSVVDSSSKITGDPSSSLKKPNRSISFSDISLPSSSPPQQYTNTTSSPTDTASFTELYPYPPPLMASSTTTASSAIIGLDDSQASPLRRTSIASTATFMFPNISPYSQESSVTDINTFTNNLRDNNSPIRERIFPTVASQENIPPVRNNTSIPVYSPSVSNNNAVSRVIPSTSTTGTNTTPNFIKQTASNNTTKEDSMGTGTTTSIASPKVSLSTFETLNLSLEQLKQQFEALRTKQEILDNRTWTNPYPSHDTREIDTTLTNILQRFETLMEKNNTDIRLSTHQLVNTLTERLVNMENKISYIDNRLSGIHNVSIDTVETLIKDRVSAQENIWIPQIHQKLDNFSQQVQKLTEKNNTTNNNSSTGIPNDMIVRQRNIPGTNDSNNNSLVLSSSAAAVSTTIVPVSTAGTLNAVTLFTNNISLFLSKLDTNTIALGVTVAMIGYSLMYAQSILDFFRIFILITLGLLFFIVFLPIILYYLRTSPVIINYSTKIRQFMDKNTGKQTPPTMAKLRNL